MKLTTKGRYALRSALYLAKRSQEGVPVSIREISEHEDISADFLEQIFFRLRKNGLVSSVRGPGGGFFLSRPPESISLLDLLVAAGEGFDFTPCTGRTDHSLCPRTDLCRAKPVWEELDDVIRRHAAGKTLASLLADGEPSAPGRRIDADQGGEGSGTA